jgi:hypothetical protein
MFRNRVEKPICSGIPAWAAKIVFSFFILGISAVDLAGQSVNLVQAVGTSSNARISSISQSFGSPNVSGDLIVVAVSWGDRPENVAVSDVLGNSYFLAVSDYDINNTQGLAIFYAFNVQGGANTVTAGFSQADGYRRLVIAEYSGVATTSPLDAAAKHQALARTATNQVTSGTGTTASNGDLIFGVAMDDSGNFGSISPGTSFSLRVALNNTDTAAEDMVQGAAGPVAATFTFSLSDHYLAQMAAFRATGGALPPISTSVSPASASVQVNQSAQFTATVQNDPQNKGATWSLGGSDCSGVACGTLSNITSTSVSYTAPAAVPNPAGVTLTATSVSDPSKMATSAITITAAPVISISVAPSSSSVSAGGSQSFTASVQNDSQNQGVTWSISGSGCSGSPCGTLNNATSSSVTYTAPATPPSPATVTLTATSVSDPSKKATSTITVIAAPVISISVAPSSSSVAPGGSQSFTASVQNDSQNQGVTWSISGSGCSGATCGTLNNATSSSVTYTAPATPPSPATVTLTATSVSDPSKSGSATITMNVDPGTPTLVQHVLCSNNEGYLVQTYDCKLPNPTLSGNAVIVAFQYSDGTGVSSVTVSDDLGDSYSSLVSHTDGNQIVNIFGAFNVAGGARAITLTFNGGSGGKYISAAVSEFYNVANTSTLDASSSHNGSGATVNAGTLSPATSGDLIYQYAINDDPGYCDSWTQGANPWNLLSADWLTGQADQYQVQSTATAINPALMQGVHPGTTGAYNSVAVALRPATAGTPPGNGIRIVHLQHNSFFRITNFSSGTQGSLTIGFPATGNLLVLAGIMVHTSPLYDVSSVADNQGNAWSAVTTLVDTSGDGDEQLAYAASATTSTTMTVTLNMSTSSGEGDSDVFLFDVTGAGSAPFDHLITANGNESAGGSFTSPPITPSTPNGMCLSIMGVASNTLAAVSPGNFLSSLTSPEGPQAPTDNNNGWSVYYNPDTRSFSSTWTNTGGPVNNWGVIASCFEASNN